MKPEKELMMSLNYLFPDAMLEGDTSRYNGEIAEKLQKVISAQLESLQIPHVWDSTCFLHLGSEIIPDSIRCSDCDTWVIPEENSHPTSVVSSGWRVEDGRILCDQCWSLFDGDKIPITANHKIQRQSEQGGDGDAEEAV
ncbi:hypothetical protein HZ994_09490 [Akkermansiaceae bacterium]|nr:hypothetical protein HZ994_09490 [Akkermansiaceae bacterium]